MGPGARYREALLCSWTLGCPCSEHWVPVGPPVPTSLYSGSLCQLTTRPCHPRSLSPEANAGCLLSANVRKAKERTQTPTSPHLRCPFYPRSPASPLFEILTKPDLEASWAVGAAEVPGGAISGPLHPPTSLVAVRQLYGGQIEAVSLLAGLFLHFSNPALIFPPWPPYPHWLPGKFPLPPPHLSVWLGRGPLASQVIELWGRQPRLCTSTFGFLPCRDWGGWKGWQMWTTDP